MSAAKPKTYKYHRRRPELTPCYKTVNAAFDDFVRARAAENRPLAQFALNEFDAYLKCGILTHGFVRLTCDDCAKEQVLAFSCKKRGFCPSCWGKRMSESAAHLVDNVLPKARYRQFVVSLPKVLRHWLSTNKVLFNKVHKIIIAELHSYYKAKAIEDGIFAPKPASISYIQRFGSALDLNVHFHIICLDGVFTTFKNKSYPRKTPEITDVDVARIIEAISQKVTKHLRRKGYLDKEGELVEHPGIDPLFEKNEALAMATKASLVGRIAFGPNAGKKVRKIGKGFGYEEEIPRAKGKLNYKVNGFSLHAKTRVKTEDRAGLERLLTYVARGPLSNGRLEILKNGEVKLKLKTPYSDGTTHMQFTQHEFMEKLLALIPPPRLHLVRWGGAFAPNAKIRKDIVLRPEVKKGYAARCQNHSSTEVASPQSKAWSELLKRVFKLDLTVCQDCGGKLRYISTILDSLEVARYLKHVGMDTGPPPRGPPESGQGELQYETYSED